MDVGNLWFEVVDMVIYGTWTYLIFVIFFTQAKFLENKI